MSTWGWTRLTGLNLFNQIFCQMKREPGRPSRIMTKKRLRCGSRSCADAVGTNCSVLIRATACENNHPPFLYNRIQNSVSIWEQITEPAMQMKLCWNAEQQSSPSIKPTRTWLYIAFSLSFQELSLSNFKGRNKQLYVQYIYIQILSSAKFF